MKQQIVKIFGHETNNSNSGEATLPIKQEVMSTWRKKYFEDDKTQNIKVKEVVHKSI